MGVPDVTNHRGKDVEDADQNSASCRCARIRLFRRGDAQAVLSRADGPDLVRRNALDALPCVLRALLATDAPPSRPLPLLRLRPPRHARSLPRVRSTSPARNNMKHPLASRFAAVLMLPLPCALLNAPIGCARSTQAPPPPPSTNAPPPIP